MAKVLNTTLSHRELPFQTTKKIEFLEHRNGIKRLDLHNNTLGKWDNLIARTNESIGNSSRGLKSPRFKEYQQANRTIYPEYNNELTKPSSKRTDLSIREKSPPYPGRITHLYEKQNTDRRPTTSMTKRVLSPAAQADNVKELFQQLSPNVIKKKQNLLKMNDYYSAITTLPASTVRERDGENKENSNRDIISSKPSTLIKQYHLRSGISWLPADETSLKVNKNDEYKKVNKSETLLARNISTSYLTKELILALLIIILIQLNIKEKSFAQRNDHEFRESDRYMDESKQINPLTKGKKNLLSKVIPVSPIEIE